MANSDRTRQPAFRLIRLAFATKGQVSLTASRLGFVEAFIREEGFIPVRVFFPDQDVGVQSAGPVPQDDDRIVDPLLRQAAAMLPVEPFAVADTEELFQERGGLGVVGASL